MKVRLSRVVRLLSVLFLVTLLLGCGGGDGVSSSSSSTQFTEKQIKEFEASSKSISEKLANAAEPGSETSLNDAKAFALTLPNVESTVVVEGNLQVKYKGGGLELFIENAPIPSLPADIPESVIQSESLYSKSNVIHKSSVGNKKAVLINTLAEDKTRIIDTKWHFPKMKIALESAGFDVDEVNGSEATPEKLANLSDYSVLVFNGHGGFVKDKQDNKIYAICTGKEWDYKQEDDWGNGTTIKVSPPWGTLGAFFDIRKHFYGITGKYFKESYASHHFNRAIFFNGACSGAKDAANTDSFMNALKEIGVVAYTGWSDVTTKGSASNHRLINLMAQGRTLQQAAESLPDEYKFYNVYDENSSPKKLITVSTLCYGPPSENDITLGGTNPSHPEIRIDSPANGISISDRRCAVKGQISPNSGYSFANIIVNGQSEILSINPYGSFEQAVGLRAGENVITIATRGSVEYQKSVTVTGVFSSDILFTTLWWNTDISDIDLHLVPIEGADGARDDCFFDHMISSWGATLDVDDIDGFGPEHITARTLPPGKYLLYVHYFDTHDQTSPTVVNVAVSTNGQQSEIFSLGGDKRMTTQDDRWNVCAIEFPSGKITPINEFIPASKSGGQLTRLPRKKSVR